MDRKSGHECRYAPLMLTHHNAKTDLPPAGGRSVPFLRVCSFFRQSVAGYPGERQLAGSGGGGAGAAVRRPSVRCAAGPLAPPAQKAAPPNLVYGLGFVS